MRDERTPVLVVGGSLVGLSTALFLAWHGMPSMVVDRNAGLSPHPRARGVNARTMELFRAVGIEERMRATESARALAENSGIIAVESLAGREIGALQESYHRDTGVHPVESPTGWCLCHQHEVEPILRARAAELGADLRFGTELISCDQDADGVTALTRDAEGTEHRVRASYLVAADGAGSGIRDGLGIGMDGPGTLAYFMNIQFEADLVEPLRGRRFVMCYTISGSTRCGLLPINNADQWLLHVPFTPGDSPEFTPERCADLVRTAAGVPDLDVTIKGMAPWESAGRAARSLGRGRVFLVGDAAHVMPPTGAFGSNTGIQDAHNLAWKLAAVLRGQAGPGLLATYDAERRPVGAATVEQAVLRSKDRPRIAGGPKPEPDPAIRPDPVVTFGQWYRLEATGPQDAAGDGPWAADPGGRPGTRAPHVALKRDGKVISSLDLYGRVFVLIAGHEGQEWIEAARAASAGLGVDLDVHQVGTDITEATGDLCAAHGLTSSGAVVVRPDGFVAWRRAEIAGADPRACLRELFERVLGSPAEAGSAGADGAVRDS